MKLGLGHIAAGLGALWLLQDQLSDGGNDCAHRVTQADHDAVEAGWFVHPLDWLLPPVGACIDSRYLGGPDDLIPGSTRYRWRDARSSLDGEVPFMWRPYVAKQARNLDKLSDALGKTVRVTSWWRGPKMSRKLDQGEFERRGGWGGYHPAGAATDIKVSGVSKADLKASIEDLITRGVIDDGGLGIYAAIDSIHYDNRGLITGEHGGQWARARWDRRPDPVTGRVNYSGGL